MSKLLIAICVFLGCGAQGVRSDEGAIAGKRRFDNRSQARTREKTSLFTYKLPERVQRQEVSGIEVVLQSDAPPPSEGYYIGVFAVAPAKAKHEKPRRIALGGQDIFKPLKEGETTTVYLSPPAEDVWLRGKEGEELKLGFEIKPANPDRPKPNVSLHIERVKANERSERGSDCR